MEDRMEDNRARYDRGGSTPADAMALFDALEPVDTDFMKGRWHGAGFLTGHKLDGMLEAYGWYGKEFVDDNSVRPLLFGDTPANLYSVHPGRLPLATCLKLPLPKSTRMKHLVRLLRPFLATRRFGARLRMLEHRGKVTAAMIYDDLPIIDIFRKLDENHLLGVMDLRYVPEPFFFRLIRGDRS